MRNPTESCFSPTGLAVRSLLTWTCTLPAVLTAGAMRIAPKEAPPSQSGLIPVTVTDPANRFVTGLERENFVILENGAPRPITYFSSVDSAILIAIISESPLSFDDNLKRPEDELIQTSSFSDALRQLIASKNQRKALIVTTAADVHDVPSGIQVVQTNPATAFKWVIEVRNQYLLRFRPSDATARVEVTLIQPRGLPTLKPMWKTAF